MDGLRETVPSLEENIFKIQFDMGQKPDREEMSTKEEVMKAVLDHRSQVSQTLQRFTCTKQHKRLQGNVAGLRQEMDALREALKAKADIKVNGV